jgi:hypothetical protein
MPNALLVSVPGTGHWTLNAATQPGCLLAATTAFIQAGRPASPARWAACPVPWPGTSCHFRHPERKEGPWQFPHHLAAVGRLRLTTSGP